MPAVLFIPSYSNNLTTPPKEREPLKKKKKKKKKKNIDTRALVIISIKRLKLGALIEAGLTRTMP